MQRIAYWLTPLIALGVALFLIVLLYRINQTELIYGVAHQKNDTTAKENPQNSVDTWLTQLSESERLGYFFPVNEIYVDVDLNQKIVHEIIYQLKADIKDPYQLFCLKEELREFELNYFLQNDKSGTTLLIHSKDQQKLQKLVATLKNYQILASVVPFKEEESWKNIK